MLAMASFEAAATARAGALEGCLASQGMLREVTAEKTAYHRGFLVSRWSIWRVCL